MVHIVKRHGHKESFDERKVYASVYAACLSAHILQEESENISSLVTREVKKWIEGKQEVPADQISKQVTEELEHLNSEAAFMYETHRDIS